MERNEENIISGLTCMDSFLNEVLCKLRSDKPVLTKISQLRVRQWTWQKAFHPGQGEAYARNLQS